MIKLYGHANRKSPNTFKLRVALAEAGAPYRYVAVDLAAGEHKKPEFLALNPHGKIPVLVDGGFVLAESDAILWYIGETFPDAKLVPRAASGVGAAAAAEANQARARVLQWCDFVSTGLYQAYVDLYIHTLPASAADKRIAWIAEAAAQKMDRLMGVMDGVLAGRAHLAGDLSAADLSAAAVIQQIKARLTPDPTAGRAHISAWYERVTDRPAWRKVETMPAEDTSG
jgi:GST-like protein